MMLSTNSIALKEWAVVCQALASGWQQILFRTGGIHEGPDGFVPEHQEFWLFPTGFHQETANIRPEFANAAELANVPAPSDGEIFLQHYCQVENVIWCDDRSRLARLDPFHILSKEIIDKRFSYRRDGLFVLIVRTWSLPEPVRLPNDPRYEGCQSWVTLNDALSTSSLRRIPQPNVRKVIEALLLAENDG